MSNLPSAVSSSRVRCSRCSRFHFRGTPCRCTKRFLVYEPKTDGVQPHVRLTLSKDADIYVTARHHTPLDPDGNWNSFAPHGMRDGLDGEGGAGIAS